MDSFKPGRHHDTGPYEPALILHGGAGAVNRHNLPPDLYHKYKSSLLAYLKSTHSELRAGSSALDSACHAVSLMEDDELFNCGRGSVFTEAGTIEMEASVMVCSIDPSGVARDQGKVKRGAAVSLVKETRHPILLAREVLLDGGDGMGGTSHLHCHLSGSDVEEWGWKERGLERKSIDYFWTKRRWDEHLRHLETALHESRKATELELPSQGTVGAVCMDSWGNLAVATSTGGLTNKKVGRIGDTPTVGAGFWAESWDIIKDEDLGQSEQAGRSWSSRISNALEAGFGDLLYDCLPHWRTEQYNPLSFHRPSSVENSYEALKNKGKKRAVAMSGTGNGDSFLRVNAVRSAGAMCRFGAAKTLQKSISAIAGPGGELELSAGERWEKTGEGEGGIIGIELNSTSNVGKVVFDFNCSGLWRAWVDVENGKERVMVFRDEYDEEIDRTH